MCGVYQGWYALLLYASVRISESGLGAGLACCPVQGGACWCPDQLPAGAGWPVGSPDGSDDRLLGLDHPNGLELLLKRNPHVVRDVGRLRMGRCGSRQGRTGGTGSRRPAPNPPAGTADPRWNGSARAVLLGVPVVSTEAGGPEPSIRTFCDNPAQVMATEERALAPRYEAQPVGPAGHGKGELHDSCRFDLGLVLSCW
ncbi:MAG: hypothetical protein JWL97_4289 [Gemmatimonadales bacterium]|nr:hypothetical protein [Gemmatimonadales bacterium]